MSRSIALRIALLAGVSLLFAAACSSGSKKPPASAPSETAAPAAAAGTCPVDQPICDFAAGIEQLVQARDYAKIASTAPGIEAGVRQQAEMAIPTGTPKLASIGCPFGAVSESCAKYFSLVFTTFKPTEDWTAHGGIFILMYERMTEAPWPMLRMVNSVEEFETRRAALAGGLAQGPCNFSGWAEDQGERGCSRSMFHQYSTDGTVFTPVDDKPGDSFQVLDPAPPPRNTAMFIATGCWGCEGPDAGIYLVLTDANGTTTTERLESPPPNPISANASLMLATACEGPDCADYSGGSGNLSTHIRTSTDGGKTWSELKTYAGYAYASIGPGNRLLISHTYGDGPPQEWTTSFELLNPSEAVVRPAFAEPGKWWPMFLPDGSLGWTYYESLNILRSDGSKFFDATGKFTAADRGWGFFFGPDGRVYVHWAAGQAASGSPLKTYLSAFNPAGVELWRRVVDESPDVFSLQLSIGGFLDSRHAIANIQQSPPAAYGQLPALIDLDAGTIQPYGAPFGVAPFVGRNRLMAMVSGPFARVSAQGDCLNIRESASASAKAITCAADGSLLKDLGKTEASGGITWINVRTLGGQEGWASAEFLKR
jgi:hypothetical protein